MFKMFANENSVQFCVIISLYALDKPYIYIILIFVTTIHCTQPLIAIAFYV